MTEAVGRNDDSTTEGRARCPQAHRECKQIVGLGSIAAASVAMEWAAMQWRRGRGGSVCMAQQIPGGRGGETRGLIDCCLWCGPAN